jgi:hypothetical protein
VLDLIMNGDFRPWFCPWNVFFSQSEQAFNHQIPLSQINAYFQTTFDTHKALLGTWLFFLYFTLSFWAWSHHEWRLPSMHFVPECVFSQSEQAFNHQIPHSQINAYFRDHFWYA